MKSRFALLISMALLAIGLPIPAHADTPFQYLVSGGEATITGYNGTVPAELDIPDVITDGDETYPVTAIGTYAFFYNQLTGLTLPDTLTTIGEAAFYNNQLTDLDLPDTLTTIGNQAFYNNQLTELDLPDILTTIGNQAFSNNELTDLTFPDRLTTIGEAAFSNNRLTDLDLPDTLTTIGDYAFLTNQLTDLDLPDTLTTISDGTFANNQLTDLTLPDTLTTIGNNAFEGNQLTDLDLPDTLTTIGNWAFFLNLLTELSVPASVTSIGTDAFGTNPELDDVRFAGTAPQMGTGALGTSDPTVRFPWKFGDPRATGGYTTPRWHGYRTIPVADVTFVGGGDIDAQSLDVDGTTTVVKPADPTKAGQVFTGWFAGDATTPFDFTTPITGDVALTAGFKSVDAPDLTGPATAAVKLGDAFTWTPATLAGNPAPTVTATGLPDGLEINDETGTITGTVTDPALTGNHNVTITATNDVDPAATLNLTISVEGFTSTIADDAATITGYHGTTPTELVIPAQITDSDGTYPVTAIGNHAFYGYQMTGLTLPGALTTIGDYAFAANRLANLTLPGALTTIGNNAFYDNRLTELTLPGTLTTISDYAFATNQLTDLDLPNTLTTIGKAAFGANQLTDLDLPGTLTTIGAGAFMVNQLTELSVPASVTSIGEMAFGANPELDNVRFAGIAPDLGIDALGTSDPTVRFPWKFGVPRATDGYTTPTWKGYDTIAVADVTFTGGGDIDAQPLDVDGTTTAVKPADPVKTGHVFTGWFSGAATAPFNFATPITGDVVLTAGFELAPVPADPAISGLNPTITGDAREGKTLTANPGKLTPADASVTYQWHANGQAIKGATKPKLKLGKAQAGKRITVTITATRASAQPATKTSAKSKIVSSAKRRIVVSTRTVGKNKPVTVTATGFKPRQKITIWLGKDKRYTGRADSRGIITKTVKFAKGTKTGTHRIRVTGQTKDGRNQTVQTTVKYR